MVAVRTELNQTKLSLRILVEFPKLDSFTKVESFRKVTSGSGSEIIRGLTSFSLCLFIGLFLFTLSDRDTIHNFTKYLLLFADG